MADQIGADLAHVLLQTPTPVRVIDRPTEGVVVATGPTGVRVTLPSFHPEYAFGPCRYGKPPDQLEAVPPVIIGWPPLGTRCLVAIADNETPWIIAFAGWPA